MNNKNRGVAQLVARMVRDHEVVGSCEGVARSFADRQYAVAATGNE